MIEKDDDLQQELIYIAMGIHAVSFRSLDILQNEVWFYHRHILEVGMGELLASRAAKI